MVAAFDEKRLPIPNFKSTKYPSHYAKLLTNKYKSGTFIARSVFAFFEISDSLFGDTQSFNSFYSVLEDKIFLDYEQDLRNLRGPGQTFFHEFGHYFANHATIRIYRIEEFRELLIEDALAVVQRYNGPDEISILEALADDLVGIGDVSHAVQDLLGGAISSGQYCGMFKWGHTLKYWREQHPGNTGVAIEASAHMFEAHFSKDKYSLMENFFPNAFEYYNQWLYKTVQELGSKATIYM